MGLLDNIGNTCNTYFVRYSYSFLFFKQYIDLQASDTLNSYHTTLRSAGMRSIHTQPNATSLLIEMSDANQCFAISSTNGPCVAPQEGWDEWDGPSSVVCDGGAGRKMSPVELQIHEYRQQQQRRVAELQQAPVPEHEPNLFEVCGIGGHMNGLVVY